MIDLLAIQQYITNSYNLDKEQAERLILEIPQLFTETRDDYIRQRHLELQEQGHKNNEIFLILQKEIKQRVFPCNETNQRQIRRIIYG